MALFRSILKFIRFGLYRYWWTGIIARVYNVPNLLNFIVIIIAGFTFVSINPRTGIYIDEWNASLGGNKFVLVHLLLFRKSCMESVQFKFSAQHLRSSIMNPFYFAKKLNNEINIKLICAAVEVFIKKLKINDWVIGVGTRSLIF